ncbi:MAG: hypothetical protein QNJ05_13525, partial [Woeseiaceae bacterium]|nr:hypothetical protein [Woeseiaceae bacterium]
KKNTVLTKAQVSSVRVSPIPDRIHEGTEIPQPKKKSRRTHEGTVSSLEKKHRTHEGTGFQLASKPNT